VEIAASEVTVDIVAEGVRHHRRERLQHLHEPSGLQSAGDAGIRLGQFIAANMVAVRLTWPFPFVDMGSPDCLRQRQRPQRIDNLRQYACLRMRRSNGSISPWTFVHGKNRGGDLAGPFIAHDIPTLLGGSRPNA
jgi:hypothetical protein